jgi:hypothetical protein
MSSLELDKEVSELRDGLQKALAANDGWLAHWYGSQILHRNALKEKLSRDSEEFKRRHEELLEKCKLKAEILYDEENLRSRETKCRCSWLY